MVGDLVMPGRCGVVDYTFFHFFSTWIKSPRFLEDPFLDFSNKLKTSGRWLKPWNVCLKSHISKIVLKKSVEVSRTKVFVQNHFFRVFGCLYVREISLQVEFKKLACVNKVAPIKWWIGQLLTIILTFWRGWIPCQQMTRWRLIFLVWFLNGHSDFTQRAAGTCVFLVKCCFPQYFKLR